MKDFDKMYENMIADVVVPQQSDFPPTLHIHKVNANCSTLKMKRTSLVVL